MSYVTDEELRELQKPEHVGSMAQRLAWDLIRLRGRIHMLDNMTVYDVHSEVWKAYGENETLRAQRDAWRTAAEQLEACLMSGNDPEVEAVARREMTAARKLDGGSDVKPLTMEERELEPLIHSPPWTMSQQHAVRQMLRGYEASVQDLHQRLADAEVTVRALDRHHAREAERGDRLQEKVTALESQLAEVRGERDRLLVEACTYCDGTGERVVSRGDGYSEDTPCEHCPNDAIRALTPEATDE